MLRYIASRAAPGNQEKGCRKCWTVYTDMLCNCGSRVARANMCMCGHQERNIVVMVHGDDFVSTADNEDLQKTTDTIGHDGDGKKQIKVLNTFISVNCGGHTYEPDVRHPEMIVKELVLQGAKTCTTRVNSLDHERFKKYVDTDSA